MGTQAKEPCYRENCACGGVHVQRPVAKLCVCGKNAYPGMNECLDCYERKSQASQPANGNKARTLNPRQKAILTRNKTKDRVNEENWGGPCRGGCGKYNQGEYYCADCRKAAAEKSFKLSPGEVELYRGAVGKPEDKITKQIVAIDGASIVPDELTWVWENKIPNRAITWVLGQPNNSKSFVTCWIVSCATTGRDWPDGSKNTGGARKVLMYSEDPLSTVTVPRLMAAGADMTKIKFLDRKSFRTIAGDNEPEKRPLDITQDLDILLDFIKQNSEYKMIVVDTVMGSFGGKNLGKNEEIEPHTSNLMDFCEEADIAFMGVLHTPKLTTNSSIDKIPGGSAIRGSGKSVFMLSRDTEAEVKNSFTLSMVKWNYAENSDGIKYKTVGDEVVHKGKTIHTAKAVWVENTTDTADDICVAQNAKKDVRDKQKDKCEMFLLTFLADGPQRSPKVYAAALAAGGFSDDTVKRALKSIGGGHIDRRSNHEGYWMTLTPSAPFPEFQSEDQRIMVVTDGDVL